MIKSKLLTNDLKLNDILYQVACQCSAQGVKMSNLKDFKHTIKLLQKKN